MKKIILTATLLSLSIITTSVFASLANKLSNLVGYTVIDSKTITGWYNANGKKHDGFEGCDYGRVIIFDDNTTLKCEGYNYQYEDQPTAAILSNNLSIRMVVGNSIYHMSN